MRALLFTIGSPYARGVRILLDELGLDYERRQFISAPAAGQGEQTAPTLQVPTLWDGSVTLWESAVIAEYLLAAYKAPTSGDPPLSQHLVRPGTEIEDRLLLATVQTLGSAVTTISQLTWTGVRLGENPFLVRCADRVQGILGWVEGRLSPEGGFFPGAVSVQDIFLACHLRFVEKRPLGLDLRLVNYPNVTALLGRLDSRGSFGRNPIPWWEPGITGYEADGVTPIWKKQG
jgi:glutathione S-transferase